MPPLSPPPLLLYIPNTHTPSPLPAVFFLLTRCGASHAHTTACLPVPATCLHPVPEPELVPCANATPCVHAGAGRANSTGHLAALAAFDGRCAARHLRTFETTRGGGGGGTPTRIKGRYPRAYLAAIASHAFAAPGTAHICCIALPLSRYLPLPLAASQAPRPHICLPAHAAPNGWPAVR